MEPRDLDGSQLTAYRAILSEAESERMARLRFERDRSSFLAAHGLTRTALSWACTEVHPAQWRFVSLPGGRPEVAAPVVRPRLRFNLSHTDGLVACVVVESVDCGIDVEATSRRVDPSTLIGLLAPAERSALQRVPRSRRAALFMRHWTLKEAYAKATGLGLSLPFDRLDVVLQPAQDIRLRIDASVCDDGAMWQLEQWWPSDRHTLALALRRGTRAPLTVVRHAVQPGAEREARQARAGAPCR